MANLYNVQRDDVKYSPYNRVNGDMENYARLLPLKCCILFSLRSSLPLSFLGGMARKICRASHLTRAHKMLHRHAFYSYASEKSRIFCAAQSDLPGEKTFDKGAARL